MNTFETALTEDEIRPLLDELAWLDSQAEEMQRLVVELCDCNSGTFNLSGVDQVAQILASQFEKLGGNLQWRTVDTMSNVDEHGRPTETELGPLIHITKRQDIRPRVLLCIHMDTVYPVNSPFQKCQMLSDGILNGPGVADAKGGLVVMLYALLAIERFSFADKLGWEVIINPDEELGSPGSANFLQERAKEADVGLLFEPKLPDGSLVSTRKGVGNYTFVVRGKSAHAGREFSKGRNAIVACCKLMTELDALNQEGTNIINVGKIEGGDALNVVPDLAIGRCNVRVSTGQDAELLDQRFRQIATKYSNIDGVDVQMLGGFTSMPKESSVEQEHLQQRVSHCGEALGFDIRWKPTGGASDGNKFSAVGLANIDTLGPLGGAIHSVDEYLEITSLVPSAKLAAFIMASLVAK